MDVQGGQAVLFEYELETENECTWSYRKDALRYFYAIKELRKLYFFQPVLQEFYCIQPKFEQSMVRRDWFADSVSVEPQ